MEWTSWAGLAAAAAVVASAWSHIKIVLTRMTDLVICRTVVEGEAAQAVLSLAWAEGKRSPLGLRLYNGTSLFVNPVKRQETVAYEGVSSDPLLFWFDGRPVIIGRKSTANTLNTGSGDSYYNGLWLYHLRGTFDTDTFIIRATEHLNALKHVAKADTEEKNKKIPQRFEIRRFAGSSAPQDFFGYSKPAAQGDSSPPAAPAPQSVASAIQEQLLVKAMRLLKWTADDLRPQPASYGDPLAGYAFPPEVNEALHEVRTWLDNEEWFRSKSIPWRRGWLLHGPAGTGKSTLARAIGMLFDLPVVVMDLATMNNNALNNWWTSALARVPCIVLLEDIDTVFDGRVNVSAPHSTTKDTLTFDCLLNCISGVGMNDGIFLIVTTNRIDKLDPALGIPDARGISSRPGRVDRAIYLGPMEEAERLKLARHIVSDWPGEVDDLVKRGADMTPAQFQNMCAECAMSHFWKEADERLKSTKGKG